MPKIMGSITRATEYKQLGAQLSPNLLSLIFGGLSNYKHIRNDWTYDEVKEELKEVININNQIKKRR